MVKNYYFILKFGLYYEIIIFINKSNFFKSIINNYNLLKYNSNIDL